MGLNRVSPSNEPAGFRADPHEQPIRVLVAEDETVVRDLLVISLRRMGYQVVAVTNGAQALEILECQSFDLVLLDVMMPEVDGFTVCRELRTRSNVPVVMLTALNRPDDVIRGLELGADNYITKPFTFRELEARLRALLRRTAITPGSDHSFQVLQQGDITLNTETHAVEVAGRETDLTETEYNLLFYFMQHPNRPIGKEKLMAEVWGYMEYDGDSNLVELAISRLRRKIEQEPARPQRLVTVRGIGYKLNVLPEAPATHRAPAPRTWEPQPAAAALLHRHAVA